QVERRLVHRRRAHIAAAALPGAAGRRRVQAEPGHRDDGVGARRGGERRIAQRRLDGRWAGGYSRSADRPAEVLTPLSVVRGGLSLLLLAAACAPRPSVTVPAPDGVEAAPAPRRRAIVVSFDAFSER